MTLHCDASSPSLPIQDHIVRLKTRTVRVILSAVHSPNGVHISAARLSVSLGLGKLHRTSHAIKVRLFDVQEVAKVICIHGFLTDDPVRRRKTASNKAICFMKDIVAVSTFSDLKVATNYPPSVFSNGICDVCLIFAFSQRLTSFKNY